ncbi:MAG: amidohydrolase family protein [Labedaea sp.]
MNASAGPTGGGVVDAHHHLWEPARRDYPWLAAAALTPIRRSYTMNDLRSAADGRVAATVLVQTISSQAETEEFLRTAAESQTAAQASALTSTSTPAETQAPLSRLPSPTSAYRISPIVYDRQPTIAGVVGWVDLADAGVAEVLERLRTGPGGRSLVGIRHQVEDEPDPDWLLRPEIIRGLRTVTEAGLGYDLLVRAPQRAAARTVADLLPQANLVLDHAGKPGIAAGEWEPWASWVTAMAARPNVSCKLSGLITEADWASWSAGTIRRYADHVLTSFGAGRVMFGSDWPVCELAGSYAAVLDLTDELISGASGTEREAILGGTARRVYRI